MKNIAAFLVLVSVLVVTACAGQPTAPAPPTAQAPQAAAKGGWEGKWEATLAAARQEGNVMVYTVIGAETRAELTSAFKEKYGIAVDFVPGRIEETTRRLEDERRAGIYLADAVISATGLFTLLKPKGFLDPIDPVLILPEVADPKAWWGGQLPILDKDRMIIGMLNQSMRFVVRNTDLTKEGDITSYVDLLEPRWKGKLALRDPTILGASNTWITLMYAQIWGREKTEQYLRELIKQDLAIVRDPRQHVEWVARGKYPVGIGTRMEDTAYFMREGAPLSWVSVAEGSMLHPGSSCVAVINRRPHPNATAVFLNWLLSKEGQSVFIKGYGWPSRRLDVATEGIHPSVLPRPGEKFLSTNEDSILASGKGLEIGTAIFGPLLK